jgi:hypothetical protein
MEEGTREERLNYRRDGWGIALLVEMDIDLPLGMGLLYTLATITISNK